MSRRRGSATLEFSLVLPILISVGVLCVDFGRLAYYYISVTNAARAGAAYGSVNLYSSGTQAQWTQNVKQAALDEFFTSGQTGNPWYNSANVTVNSSLTNEATSGYWYVTVTVSYPFKTLISWSLLPGYTGSTVTLSKTVVMRGTI